MLSQLQDLLTEPQIKNIDMDSHERITIHKSILKNKPLIRDVFIEFYDTCRKYDENFFSVKGLRVELGAGSSFFKNQYPDILSTDIEPSDGLDQVVNALKMPFSDGEVRVLYAINCFHHLPDPRTFFTEANRVLAEGGGIVIIDPYYGWLARWFYRRLFKAEHFNENQVDWKTPTAEHGPMHGANQALSYIVFVRDREQFATEFPQFIIVEQRTFLNYIRYVFSGGLNFRQLAPTFLGPLLRLLEWVFSPLSGILALHHVIVIKKVQGKRSASIDS